MRKMSGLMMRADVFDLSRRVLDVCFRLITLLEDDLSLVVEFAELLFQRGHSGLACEQRVDLHRAAATENDPFRGNKFAIESGHSERWLFLLRRQRVVESRKNHYAAEQLTHERFERSRRNDFIN